MAKKKTTPFTLKSGNFTSCFEGAHVSFRQYSKSPNVGKKIKHVLLLHGAVEYHKRYLDLIEALIDKFGNSIVVSCMDFVGHGYSGGPRSHVEDFDTYSLDFLKFARVHTDLYLEREVETTHVIGHCLGAVVALKTMVDFRDQLPFPVHSMVLTNPCIRPNISLPSLAKKLVESVSETLGKTRVPNIYSGKDITSDSRKAASFDNDQLNSQFITLGMANTVLKTCAYLMPYSYYLQTPTLFILSGKDKIVNVEATKLFVGGVDKNLASTLFYPEAKHDILNETCAKEVFQEIIEYIQDPQLEKE